MPTQNQEPEVATAPIFVKSQGLNGLAKSKNHPDNANQVPALDLATIKFDPRWALKVAPSMMIRRRFIPLLAFDDKFHVAVERALDTGTTRLLERLANCPIEEVIATGDSIRELQGRLFGDLREAIRLEKPLVDPNPRAEKTVTDASPEEAVDVCDQILKSGIVRQASDIHFNVNRDGTTQIRLRIDGILTDDLLLPPSLRQPLMNRIKVLGGLDISEKRASQDGSFRFDPGGVLSSVEIRIATIPARHGERITLRLLARNQNLLTLRGLGFHQDHRTLFEKAIQLTHGMILITGPTGSGKSTTLYAGLNYLLDRKEVNAMTIEDPVEYEIDGVTQTEVDAKKQKVSFASSLRSILRHDPDVVMLGEIRDQETAEMSVRAAMTGHLVLSTLHTNTALGAITRLMDLGVDRFLVASVLRLVAAQRLVRRLCPDCSKPREITEAEAISLRNPKLAGTTCYEANGCLKCAGKGYIGRTGLYEIVAIGPEETKLISSVASDKSVEEELRQHSRAAREASLLANGIEKIHAGETSVKEVIATTLEFA